MTHVRADVDVSTFSPDTISFLDTAAQIWNADDVLAALLEASSDPALADPELLENLQLELLDDRNTQLVVHIFDAIEEYQRVVVPWGALHLPAIEAAVIERGYTLASSGRHSLISWSALLAAIL